MSIAGPLHCPYCLVTFNDRPVQLSIGTDVDGLWMMIHRTCPTCKHLLIFLAQGHIDNHAYIPDAGSAILVKPRVSGRPPCPPEVPEPIRQDYTEACVVLSVSPRASAALSRRCLQHVLRDAASVRTGNLVQEIQQVIDSGTLPSYLTENLNAIRAIGNFSAHPDKSESSGEVISVEPGEAEWNLDVLEGLFDFYYVQPAINQRKKDALNEKLQDAGKKPIP